MGKNKSWKQFELDPWSSCSCNYQVLSLHLMYLWTRLKCSGVCEGTVPKEIQLGAERGRDIQHITWECQRAPRQAVPATGPGAYFN